jgi:poly(A) polymerase
MYGLHHSSEAKQKIAQGIPSVPAQQIAASEIVAEQVRRIAFPKYMGIAMRDVWYLQSRFHQQTGSRPFKLMSHPRFRAAFDFLQLRAEVGDVDRKTIDWWVAFQTAEATHQTAMTQLPNKSSSNGAVKAPQKKRHRNKNYRSRNSANKAATDKHD